MVKITRHDGGVAVAVIRLSRWFGFSVRTMPDSNGKWWLSFVVWYPRSTRRLGYFYPSMPWFNRSST